MVWSTYGGDIHFLFMYTCCYHILEGNKCKVNFYYDDHEYEGYVCSPQY